jgi:2-polyprenyl-3-methyl-5-hydroxy-6-metoxy-1,4-benzoquinol methylase
MDEAVVAFWTRAAEAYETEVPYFGPMGERIVAHAGLRPGQSVLDVACGKGATLLPAARAVGDGGGRRTP